MSVFCPSVSYALNSATLSQRFSRRAAIPRQRPLARPCQRRIAANNAERRQFSAFSRPILAPDSLCKPNKMLRLIDKGKRKEILHQCMGDISGGAEPLSGIPARACKSRTANTAWTAARGRGSQHMVLGACRCARHVHGETPTERKKRVIASQRLLPRPSTSTPAHRNAQ